MSPPCQPFSRNGNFKDVDDRRSDAFQIVCEIIKDKSLPNLGYVLMENVMGFEKSQMREIFIDCLTSAGFHHQEFIISPTQIGVANTRHRYYCIARTSQAFEFASSEVVSGIKFLLLSGFTLQEMCTELTTFSNVTTYRFEKFVDQHLCDIQSNLF